MPSFAEAFDLWQSICSSNHPKNKLRKLKEKLLGMEGEISMQKRSKMPFTLAFMEEVMRFRTLMPFSVHHATSEDTKLNGYFIPKGTIVRI